MVKSGAPVFVLLFAFLFKLEKPSWLLSISIAIICLGVAVMVANETGFHLGGYLKIQAATILSGLRWTLTQILLKNADLGLNNPLATSLVLAPVISILAFTWALFGEGLGTLLASKQFDTWQSGAIIILSLLGGGVIAFLMITVEFQLICSTSVVTLSVAGICKEILTIGGSMLVFGDIVTSNMAVGLIISLFGIAGMSILNLGYNYTRIIQAQKQIDDYQIINPSEFELSEWEESDNK
jgi:solute carrier family 35 protein C2